MDTVDRNYVEAVIREAETKTFTACQVAVNFGLTDVAERLSWALDFLQAARAKLPASEKERP